MELEVSESNKKMKNEVISYYNLSTQQGITFNEFKRRVLHKFEEFVEDDFQLYRFFKARKFDVNKAEIMFSNHTKFRQKYKVDSILEDYKPKEPLKSFWVYHLLGFDKEGSLLILCNMGDTDTLGLVKSTSVEDCMLHCTYYMEIFYKRALEYARKFEEPVKGYTWIFDYNNYTLAEATNKTGIQLAMGVTSIFETNYPELLKVGYVINAPAYFTIPFNIIKMIMPEEWVRKVKVYGKDGWSADLLQLIDPEIWPAYLGGTKTDPDGNPRCITTIPRYGKVPKRYYFKNLEHRLINQDGVEKYNVRRRSKVTVVHRVDIPGSFLDWEFESELHDIGFGLFCKTEGKEILKELICIQRVNSHMCCQIGIFLCETTGEYIIILDNSYSWFRGKQIFMKSSVRMPSN